MDLTLESAFRRASTAGGQFESLGSSINKALLQVHCPTLGAYRVGQFLLCAQDSTRIGLPFTTARSTPKTLYASQQLF
jgi:hypothetical protein